MNARIHSSNESEHEKPLAVYHRGFFAKGAFALFGVAPCVFVSAAAVRFCVNEGKPLVLAAGVVVLCLFALDRFAYYTFCEVAVTPEGLIHRGGGVFWRRMRKRTVLPWSDYIYTLFMVGAHYAGVSVHDRKECADRHIDRPSRAGRGGVPPTLDLHMSVAAAVDEFNAFVREIRKHNPDVIIETSPALRIDPDR